jgi:glycosyltransferase involved in cell wall biosynthesis
MPSGAHRTIHALSRRLTARGIEPLVVSLPDGKPPPDPAMLGYTVMRLESPAEAMVEMFDHLTADAALIADIPTAQRALALTARRPRPLRLYFTQPCYGYAAPWPGTAESVRHAVPSRFLADLTRAYLGYDAALLPPLIEPDSVGASARGDTILFFDPVPPEGVHRVAEIAARLAHRRFLVVQAGSEAPPPGLMRGNVETIEAPADLRAVYSRARLLLKPTITEDGVAHAVAEAQAGGIPVVASDRAALPEMVGPGGIVLPAAADTARWCEAIESLFADEARHAALSAAARAHAARADLDADTVTARFLEFLAP